PRRRPITPPPRIAPEGVCGEPTASLLTRFRRSEVSQQAVEGLLIGIFSLPTPKVADGARLLDVGWPTPLDLHGRIVDADGQDDRSLLSSLLFHRGLHFLPEPFAPDGMLG